MHMVKICWDRLGIEYYVVYLYFMPVYHEFASNTNWDRKSHALILIRVYCYAATAICNPKVTI